MQITGQAGKTLCNQKVPASFVRFQEDDTPSGGCLYRSFTGTREGHGECQEATPFPQPLTLTPRLHQRFLPKDKKQRLDLERAYQPLSPCLASTRKGCRQACSPTSLKVVLDTAAPPGGVLLAVVALRFCAVQPLCCITEMLLMPWADGT